MIRRVRVSLTEGRDRSYDIRVGADIQGEFGSAIRTLGLGLRALLVADAAVADSLAPLLGSSLHAAGITTHLVVVPSGEGSKTLDTARRLYDAAFDAGLDRRSVIVALGGGMVGDLAGFVAATFLRGIAFVQVPTTLLAQVDASVGGKVAVDHPRGKNLIGAFHQPRLVWADVRALAGLPKRELRAGLAEAIKMGIIADARYYQFIRRNYAAILDGDESALVRVVVGSCRLKAEVVHADEREESGQRMLLNFGHTIGHAVEAVAGYGNIRHGEAVAIGMCVEGRLALRCGRWSERWQSQLEALCTAVGLPTRIPGLPLRDLVVTMGFDKKSLAGKLHWVLPERPGSASIVTNVQATDVAAVATELGAEA